MNLLLFFLLLLQLGGLESCVKDFASFDALYSALDPQYKPALVGFTDSDEVFARIRVTAFPLQIQAVNTMEDVPFKAEDVVGLDDIIGGTGKTLDQLVADKRVRMLGKDSL